MLTKATIQLVKELHDKKGRQEHNLFLVEGEKSIVELLHSDFVIKELFVTAEFIKKYQNLFAEKNISYKNVDQQGLEKIGTLESNNAAIAVVVQKEQKPFAVENNEIVLALDTIRDPGNLGTIIRIADWYGVKKILCSETTTDFYNPKTISATKGSFTRIHIFYTNLVEYIHNVSVPVLGAFLGGDNVHSIQFPTSGILVMGSESHGISDEISKCITQKITIPSYGQAESLNVSIATAVILDNWKRIVQ